MMKFKKNSFFSPYFYQISLNKDYSKIKDEIIKKIMHQALVVGKNDIGWNIHTSFGDDVSHIIHNINELDEMVDIYSKYIKEFTKKIFKKDIKFDISELWYNVYQKGDSAPVHNHQIRNGNVFSCVHFLKFNPEIHNSLTFLNPRRASNNSLIKKNDRLKNIDFYANEFSPKLKEDDLIIFPANLAHKVEPSTTDDPRITIAFNIGLND